MAGWLDSFFGRTKLPGVETAMVSLPTSRTSRRKLLLFIHGLGGGPNEEGSARYWGKFAELAKADAELAQIYDIRFFSYASSCWAGRKSTPVPMSAEQLHAQLTTEWREYDTIDIIAHSQGGLVARRYIADCVKRKQNVRIGRAIFFDVPNMGAAVGKGTELPLAGRAVS